MPICFIVCSVIFALWGGKFPWFGSALHEDGHIDYDQFGYDVSLNDFKSQLFAKNIQYNSDDLIFLRGISLASGPPVNHYCGYVTSDDGSDYWYGAWHSANYLRDNTITKENPNSCQHERFGGCFCNLENELNNSKLLETSSKITTGSADSTLNRKKHLGNNYLTKFHNTLY